MPSSQAFVPSFDPSRTHQSAWLKLRREVTAFFSALARPGRIVGEMEQLRGLYQRAERLEATDPQAAAMLRRKASRIGLDG